MNYLRIESTVANLRKVLRISHQFVDNHRCFIWTWLFKTGNTNCCHFYLLIPHLFKIYLGKMHNLLLIVGSRTKYNDCLKPILSRLLNTSQTRGGGGRILPLLIRLFFFPLKHKIRYVESAWYHLLISIRKFAKFWFMTSWWRHFCVSWAKGLKAKNVMMTSNCKFVCF